MSPASLEYIRSQAYQLYKNAPSRPDSKLPPLDTDENGGVTLAPGELYCRWRDLRGTLCPKKKRFNSHTALNSHLKEVHKLQVAARRRGNLSFSEDQNAQQWYSDMDAGRMPSWPLGQSSQAALGENSAQAGREPSHLADTGDVPPASCDSVLQDILPVSCDGVLPAPEEDRVQADREPSHPADAEDVPLASCDGVLPAGTERSVHPGAGSPSSSAQVKQEPGCKSESGSEEEPSTSEPPFRMDLPWDASGNPNIREMLRLCGKDDSFRCRYCQEKDRECPGTISNDRCEIWSRFVPPSAYMAGAESGHTSNMKEEIDEDDFILSLH